MLRNLIYSYSKFLPTANFQFNILKSNNGDKTLNICPSCKYCTIKTNFNQSNSNKTLEDFEPKEILNKTVDLKELDLPNHVKIEPIKSLKIKDSIEKISKNGSFVKNLFFGKFDRDFLSYPHILQTRNEFIKLLTQSEMVERYFKLFIQNQNALKDLGFFNLWKLSITEMMTVFEAVGSSVAIKTEDLDFKQLTKGGIDLLPYRFKSYPTMDFHSQKSVINLLIHNCLSFAAIEWSDNDDLRDKLLNVFNNNPDTKIGFAWSEKEPTLGSTNFVDWVSKAKLSEDQKSWIISGVKTRIIKEDYDYFIIFCRTNDYPEDEINENIKSSFKSDKPQPGVVGFLISSKMIGSIEDEEIINGLVFQRIKFDNLLLSRENHQLIDASPLGIRSLNVKGIGLLGTSAYILGQLKTLLRECYRYLIDNKNGLLDCQSIERILCDITYKIYSLESCIFLTSQMFDSFENIESNPEMHLEASICKILAIEYSHEILNSLQTIYGSKLLITSPLHDMINILDSFLENTLYHRLLISTFAMHFMGYMKHVHIYKKRMAPFYPLYAMKEFFIRRRQVNNKPLMTLDLKGYVHPSLKNQADQLEYCVHQFEYAAEAVLVRWGKDQPRQQNDLERLSQIAIDLFLMTCTLSRGSRAYCDGFRNGDIDFRATISVITDGWLRVRKILDDIEHSEENGNEIRNRDVHRTNIKYNGYFASSPLEKFYY